MIRRRSKMVAFALAATLIAVMAVPWSAFAADHLDAPSIGQDPAADITDIYAFRSPENADNLVAVLNVNPLSIPGATDRGFASDVVYGIHVDNTGDLVADATVGVTFSAAQAGQPQAFTVTGLGAPIVGQTTPSSGGPAAATPNVAVAGGIRAFAGPRDDPFFFDLAGFQQFLAGPFVPANGLRSAGDTPVDAFAGVNVSSIVVELPIVALTGQADSSSGTIRVWATTSRGGSQIDRMGIPTINTVLIPTDQKDGFNTAGPVNDVADYRATGQATIEALRGAVGAVAGFPGEDSPGIAADTLATILIPDVVTINFAQPVQFPNGRRLTDDVIDAALSLVLNRGDVLGGGPAVSDGVNANDVSFLTSFPYLSAPHQPATLQAGAPGAQGPAGVAGTRGLQGSAGPQGPEGPAGAAGTAGPAGARGSQGAAGAQGSQGDAGASGAQGSSGSTGPQGTMEVEGDDGSSALAVVALILAAVALAGVGFSLMRKG